jgi:[protein-PII] uridylyltransferase
MMDNEPLAGGLPEQCPGAAVSFQRGRAGLIGRTLGLGRSPEEFFQSYSRLVDDYFRHRMEELSSPLDSSFAALAVGGYGRGELCLHSDIDILLLWKGKVPKTAEQVSREIFFPLWDLGLDLGNGVRDLKGCLRLARADFQVLTSLLSARLLSGDHELFDLFQRKLGETVRDRRKPFLAWLGRQNDERAAGYGMSGGLVEPDLKNGIGGLRDYQQILWLRRVELECTAAPFPHPFTPREFEDIGQRALFILRARNALHYVAGRRKDRLHLELQPQVSPFMTLSADRADGEVERFLSRLHQDMNRIKFLRSSLLRSCTVNGRRGTRRLAEGVVSGPDGLRLESPGPPDATLGLSLFARSAETGIPLSWLALRQVEEAGSTPVQRLTGAELDLFLSILGSAEGIGAAEQMLECGFLGRLIPEFGQVQDLVQFDAYHLYPVGRHSLETVSRLTGFSHRPDSLYGEIRMRVAHPERLLLAGLLHDVGKGGEAHEQRGALLAENILRRLGVDQPGAQEILFLIQHHLLLFKTATRKDLSDEAAVSGCAELVGSPERLDMLMLLSVADAQATGPKAWNDWIGSLLNELYFKLRNLLTRSLLSDPDARVRLCRTRERVRELASPDLDREFVEQGLDRMPSRYTLSVDPAEIVTHLQLVSALKAELETERRRVPGGRGGIGTVLLQHKHLSEQGCHELTIAAEDQIGLFSTICGVLALHDLNILSAEIFTWSDGVVVDLFKVQNVLEDLDEEELFARIRRGIKHSMNGKLSLAYRLDEKRNSPLARTPMASGKPPLVRVDAGATDFYTLIEVLADDRLGRLHEIAETFSRCGVCVHIAKIATHGDRIADTFYVRDELGQKLVDHDRVKAFEDALLHTLR